MTNPTTPDYPYIAQCLTTYSLVMWNPYQTPDSALDEYIVHELDALDDSTLRDATIARCKQELADGKRFTAEGYRLHYGERETYPHAEVPSYASWGIREFAGYSATHPTTRIIYITHAPSVLYTTYWEMYRQQRALWNVAEVSIENDRPIAVDYGDALQTLHTLASQWHKRILNLHLDLPRTLAADLALLTGIEAFYVAGVLERALDSLAVLFINTAKLEATVNLRGSFVY